MRAGSWSRSVATAAVALVCGACVVVPALANSAQAWWSGSSASGVVLTEGDSPLVVETEDLIFDIQEFPDDHYREAEDYLAYGASVTARYFLSNPSDYAVSARLLFPFGTLPHYVQGTFDEEQSLYVTADDTEKFDIKVDGEPVERVLRHTLSDGGDHFELDYELSKLHDGYVEDEFFAPDLPVVKYTYAVSGVEVEDGAPHVAFDVTEASARTKYLMLEQDGYALLEADGASGDAKYAGARVSASVHGFASGSGEGTFNLCIFGEQPDQAPELRVYFNGAVEDGDVIPGKIELVATEQTTFEAFALQKRPADSPVLAHDWYNALVELLRFHEYTTFGVIGCSERDLNLSYSLLRWYEYELFFEPGQSLVNEVSAPLYPTIDATDYEQPLYEYEYLLSPAQTWSEFGTLRVGIDTPYSLIDARLEGFSASDGAPGSLAGVGYVAEFSGLPEGELTFTLCEVPEPTKKKSALFSGYGLILLTPVVVVFVLAALIGLFIGRLVSKKRR